MKNLRARIGCLLLCFVVCMEPLSAQESKVPDTPAGRRLSQMLTAMGTEGDTLEDFLRNAFEKREDEDYQRRKSFSSAISEQLGDLKLVQIIRSSEAEVVALCQSSVGPNVELSISVTDEEPHRINKLQVVPAASEEASDDSPLSAEEKTAVVNALMRELRSKYVFPEVAEEMCQDLQQSLDSDGYAAIRLPDEFASALTTQLREICKDKHLRIRAGQPQPPSSAPGRREIDNHGFVKAEILPGGIGYLKFNFFSGDPEAEKTAAAAMNFLANSEAIIFDLRQNGGGSPSMIAFLSGYLFDESVHLNSFYNRPTDSTTETWSRDDVPGERFGQSKPVYVLTSNYSFSGAEEFTYNLKNLKRGTIVGETTGGGAHPVMPISLGKRLSMTMPFARAINPITKTNWEGVGVEPDVKVSADQALEKAIELAKQAIE